MHHFSLLACTFQTFCSTWHSTSIIVSFLQELPLNLGSYCHEAFIQVFFSSYKGGSNMSDCERGVTLCTWRSWCRHVIRSGTKTLRRPNIQNTPPQRSPTTRWQAPRFIVTDLIGELFLMLYGCERFGGWLMSLKAARSRGGSVFIELRLTRSFDVKKVRLTAINFKND